MPSDLSFQASSAHSCTELQTSATIDLIKQHRSIRAFKNQPIPEKILQEIIDAGKAAPSSSFIQCTSIIRITDLAIRDALTEICSGQMHVKNAPEFLVFCIDFNRHAEIVPEAKLGFAEQLITGIVDVSLFSQNLSLAAESLGLGTVYIGAIRNKPLEIAKLLKLPEHTFPIFGLCLGYPDQNPEIKPRLPNPIILHENQYFNIKTPSLNQELQDYDEVLKEYFRTRTDNARVATWSEGISHKLNKEARPFMKECLEAQGFLKK
jgi:nitroreductase